MIKLHGNIFTDLRREKIINLVYTLAGYPKIDFNTYNRQSSILNLPNKSYYLLHEVFLYKGKTKIDKREVSEINNVDLHQFLSKYIESEVEGLDLIALSVDKKHLLFFNHDGDIWEKHFYYSYTYLIIYCAPSIHGFAIIRLNITHYNTN